MPLSAPMYTRPANTVGLASSKGGDWPAGGQCHTWVADAAFDGVKAVAGLTELCCGPCRYCGQSRLGPAAAATGACASTTTPTRPDIPSRARARVKRRIADIPAPLRRQRAVPPRRVQQRLSTRPAAKRRYLPRGINHVTVHPYQCWLQTVIRVRPNTRADRRIWRVDSRADRRGDLRPELPVLGLSCDRPAARAGWGGRSPSDCGAGGGVRTLDAGGAWVSARCGSAPSRAAGAGGHGGGAAPGCRACGGGGFGCRGGQVWLRCRRLG